MKSLAFLLASSSLLLSPLASLADGADKALRQRAQLTLKLGQEATPDAPATLPARAAIDSRAEPLPFGSAGCNGIIHAIAYQGDTVIFGGDFQLCGDLPSAGVVSYNPENGNYAALGSGVSGVVQAVLVSGDDVYVGGLISRAGEVEVRNLARWDGQSWHAVGTGTANGTDGVVHSIAEYNGAIHVAGEFSEAGGIAASNAARYRQEQWEALGPGLNGRVNVLRVHNDRLIAGGRFQAVGELEVNLIAQWDGAQWSPIGEQFPPGQTIPGIQPTTNHSIAAEVRDLRSHNGLLYAAGRLNRRDTQGRIADVAVFDQSWTPVGSTLTVANDNGYGSAFVDWSAYGLVETGVDPLVYTRAGIYRLDGESIAQLPGLRAAVRDDRGGIVVAGRPGVDGPAYLSGDQFEFIGWQPLARARVSGDIHAIKEGEQRIFVGGRFTHLAGVPANNVASWNGADWRSLGMANGNGTDATVRALEYFDGELYAGGDFSSAGGQPANLIARWNGALWSPMGEGFFSSRFGPGRVQAIHAFGGEIFAGGYIESVGGVGRWNGSTWLPLGGGGNPALGNQGFGCRVCFPPTISGFTEFAGDLYLSGGFRTLDSVHTPPVVRWNGTQMELIGSGDGLLYRMLFDSSVINGFTQPAVHDGRLILATGSLHTQSLIPGRPPPRQCANLVAWDGAEATALLNPFIVGFGPEDLCFSTITSIGVQGGEIHVAGLTGELSDPSFENRRVVHARVVGQELQQTLPLALESGGIPYQRDFRTVFPGALRSAGDLLLPGAVAFARMPTVQQISRRADGIVANAASATPALSADGSKAVFASAATNLQSGGNSGAQRIYLRDRDIGRNQAVSDLIGQSGLADPSVAYSRPSLSADALSIAFEGDNGQVYALRANRSRLLSAAADGSPGNDLSWAASVSPDGTQVAFASRADNLSAAQGDGTSVYLHQLADGSNQRIEVAGGGDSQDPALANHGTLALVTRVGGQQQIYYSYLNADGVREGFFVSQSQIDGALGNQDSGAVRLSADGRYGVFESRASNLIDGDDNGSADIYWFWVENGELRDLQRVSESTLGLAGNADSHSPSISDDGQLIAFASVANNLTELDYNASTDIFVHFRTSRETRRVNGTLDFEAPDAGDSVQPALSADGTTLVFSTQAQNLGGGADAQVAMTRFATPRRSDGFAAKDLPRIAATPLPLPYEGFSSCPGGYFIATVDDGSAPGLQQGPWGMELLLESDSNRELAGGLNFGSLVNTSQPGFAGFNIANARNEPQMLQIQASGFGAEPDQLLRARILLLNAARETIFSSPALLLGLRQPFEHSIELQPGYYTLVVEALEDSNPEGASSGQFFLSATSRFVDRIGGGFQGGAVVGGYHGAPMRGGVSGFAAFCAPVAEIASAKLVPFEGVDGSSAAGDLRLRLLDRELVPIISAE